MRHMLKIIIAAALLAILVACGGNGQTPIPDTPENGTYANGNGQQPPPDDAYVIPASKIIPDYIVDIEIDFDNRFVTGVQRIILHNTTSFALDRVLFNIPFNAFAEGSTRLPFFPEFENRIFQHGRYYGGVDILLVTVDMVTAAFDVTDTLLTVHLDEHFLPGYSIEIGLVFEASVPPLSHRTGSNNYAMWFGNFLPTLVVLDNERWHVHPHYPAGHPFFTTNANFTVNITAPAEFTIVATGTAGMRNTTADAVTTTVSAPLVRDFAFAVLSNRDYNMRQVHTESGFEITIHYHRSTGDSADIDSILNTAMAAFDYFTARIGALPYNNIEIVETELFFNTSIKYPGIVFVDTRQMRTAAVHHSITRDIGHQWFYNVVGHNPVTEAWLAQGLVTFLQLGFTMSPTEISEFVNNSYTGLEYALNNMGQNELFRDVGTYDRWQDFHNVQRQRGMFLFYALWREMGENAFDEFLQAYYQRYAFSIATAQGMMDVATEIHGECLEDLFDKWINSPVLPPLPE